MMSAGFILLVIALLAYYIHGLFKEDDEYTTVEYNIVSLDGYDEYETEIVGESFYQEALDNICGGKTREGHEHEVMALIYPEDNNQYDKKAVRIDIEGQTIGYLSKKDAREYRKQIKEAGHKGASAACKALIVGGWKRGNSSEGHYGVRLDIQL